MDRRRLAGVSIPLSSLRGARDGGIGEIFDLVPMIDWAVEAGQHVIALLPLGELAPGETSPYNALSTFAIDPLYVTPSEIPELAGVAEAEPPGGGDRLLRERVRAWKEPLFEEAFRRFRALPEGCARKRAWERYRADNTTWLDDHALFRALYDEQGRVSWHDWPVPLGRRSARALDRARRSLADAVARHAWLQFVAEEEWWRAREHARRRGVLLLGDLPFAPSGNSADVWANQRDFDPHRSVGAPPDDFSATGQRWGLPMLRWRRMREGGWRWFRSRFRRMSALFDVYRIDHVVGLFRTWAFREDSDTGRFDPARESAQIAQGREILQVGLEESGPGSIVAEDLGLIPDWVRETMADLDVPGYKVFRWERANGQFIDPRDYPECSIATFGTHDQEPLVPWWDSLPEGDRHEALALAGASGGSSATLLPDERRALLSLLYRSGSRYVILQMQDLFGWAERVNLPATVGEQNWTFRLPVSLAELRHGEASAAQNEWLRTAIDGAGRLRTMG